MKKIFKGFGIYILILAIVLAMALFYDMTPKEQVKDISYSTLVDYIAKEEVKDIEFQEYEINATLDNGDKVHTYIHNSLDVERLHEQYLDAQSAEGKVKVSNAKPEEQPWIVSLIPTLIMIGVLIFFWVMIMRQQGGGGKAMSFGRSRAKMQTNLGKLTFKDVAGLDEEKEELQEIVDFLKNPRKYHNLGAFGGPSGNR